MHRRARAQVRSRTEAWPGKITRNGKERGHGWEPGGRCAAARGLRCGKLGLVLALLLLSAFSFDFHTKQYTDPGGEMKRADSPTRFPSRLRAATLYTHPPRHAGDGTSRPQCFEASTRAEHQGCSDFPSPFSRLQRFEASTRAKIHLGKLLTIRDDLILLPCQTVLKTLLSPCLQF